VLLPIFDSLFERHEESMDGRQALVKIRVTYFEDQGTVIGVNFCHALGDTSTCVHFVQSWGKQMRRKLYQRVGADRSKACVSGMMTADIADVMGLSTINAAPANGAASLCQNYLSEVFRDLFVGNKEASEKTLIDTSQPLIMNANDRHLVLSPDSIPHEYVRLVFPIPLLSRLKEMGSYYCKHDGTFVSTNDMLTSYGWLLKRHLSQNYDHNLSIVINLRGRSGVDSVLFGNGISHVVATHFQPHNYDGLDLTPEQLFTDSLCLGAKSIRQALQEGLLNLPSALLASQMGRALAAPSNSTLSFSTTSWGQFPLYRIRFGEHSLACFHGHPAYPLPEGKTFASVITPSPDGACWYEMLLPSDQAQEAHDRHFEMTSMCMDWVEPSIAQTHMDAS